MYREILICAVIIFFLCEYTSLVSTKRFINDNKDILLKLKEADYDFLLKARWGEEVNINEMFEKRIRNAMIALGIGLVIIIANFSYITLIIVLIASGVVFKFQYLDLKTYRQKHMHEIDVQLPYYLKNLEILIQHYTVPVAIGKSIETAPPIFKE